MPPSLLAKWLKLPLATVRSVLSKPRTASVKVRVTKLVSPMISAVSLKTIDLTLGGVVSTPNARSACAVLPNTSLRLAWMLPAAMPVKSAAKMLTCQLPSACTVAW